MTRRRELILNGLTVAVSTLLAVALLEIALRLLPVAWAPPVQPPTADNPIQRYAPNQSFTWSLGWDFYVVVHGRTNAQGFVADYDYDAAAATPLVAVIGDSMIQALEVPFAESVTGRLQATMGGRGRAYAFAQSGSPLSQYVAYAQHAAAVYRPQKMVVSVVDNDFDESVYEHRKRDGIYHLHPRPGGGFEFRLTPLPDPGLIGRVLRHSALALYLARNVGVSKLLDELRFPTAQAAEDGDLHPAKSARIAEGEAVIAWFLATLPDAAALAPRDIVIVVDAVRPRIYDADVPAAEWVRYFGHMRTKLIAQARTMGFEVIDLDAVFRAAYARDRAPFEFPTDGHWNSHGHAVVAEAVRAALGGWTPRSR